MARDTYLDVLLEVPKDSLDLSREHDRTTLVEKLRHAADAKVAAVPGAVLHTDRDVEVVINEGRHLITNTDTLLIATRWHVTVPESAAL